MDTFQQIVGLACAGLIIWGIYRAIKGRPEQFSRANIMKSFSTLGVLALILIAFVALLVVLTR